MILMGLPLMAISMKTLRNLPFCSKAVLSTLPVIDFRPDIIHCHDWQTGLIPIYLDNFRYSNEYYRNIKTIMTIHNLKFQGTWDTKTVRDITGLPDYYFVPDKLEAYKDANYLKRNCLCRSHYNGE